MNDDFYNLLTKTIVEGSEGSEEEIRNLLSESYDLEDDDSQMVYLYRMEQFFSDNDLYKFKGWGDGLIYGAPDIGKFWVTVTMVFPKELEVEGARRIIGKEKINKVSMRRGEDGRYVVTVKILRSILDDIERENRRIAARIARSDDNGGVGDDTGETPL